MTTDVSTTTLVPLNPLDWRVGIVDKAGRPTPEFQRRWLSQTQNNENLVDATNTNAAAIAANAAKTGFGFFAGGLLLDHELLGAGVFPDDIKFITGGPAGNDIVTCQIAPTSDATLTVVVGGIIIANIVILAGELVGSVTWVPSPYTLTARTQFKLFAPTPVDPTLTSVSGAIFGTKS